MLTSYALGILAIVAMAVAWVCVQLMWRKVFPDAFCDPDVLAGRMGCGGCTGDSENCESERRAGRRVEEENS
jgi:hypothetical protein